MDAFGRAALFGLCWGFLWGIGCSLAIMYSIYLGGYRKAIKDSLKQVKPKRYTQVLEKLQARRAEKKAASASSKPL
ncbi:MAG: hypothetical protein ABSC47_04425 [Terracidiphilus sp.]|jgi:hypothetical protein